MKYESNILKRLIDTYGVVGNPRYISEIIKEFIVQGKERFPNLFTYQSDWLAHIDEFGLNPSYSVSYTGQSIYAPNTLERPVKSAILKGQTLVNIVNNDNWESITTTLYTQNINIKKGQTYTVIGKLENSDKIVNDSPGFRICVGSDNSGTSLLFIESENTFKQTFTNNENETIHLRFYNQKTNYKKLMIIEGNYTNIDIPYFEGMQSVKMPVLTTSNEDGTKTNILTVNEPVELRGIGDVQDTLDLMTGELTERIGEIVLDGSVVDNTILRKNGSSFLMIRFEKIGFKKINDTTNIISSKLRNAKYYSSEPFNVGDVVSDAVGWGFGICFATNETATRDEAISYLNSLNPIVQGYLAQESIKTVDLKVVDQDGNPVNQLSAFDSTTHIISDSESDNSLIAIAEVEVPTKLIEALNAVKSLSSDVEMLINEVDNAQKLQDENSTMVMSAMTELYEMVLVMGGGS